MVTPMGTKLNDQRRIWQDTAYQITKVRQVVFFNWSSKQSVFMMGADIRAQEGDHIKRSNTRQSFVSHQIYNVIYTIVVGHTLLIVS